MDFNNENIAIYACQFQAFVERAKVQIKFPCNYFLQWKANNGKVIVSSQNRFQASKSQIVFNETLSINVNILYDKVNNKYLKKESLLMINLISKSRPDQIKLVGRVAIDLADVLNSNSFDKLTSTQLQYCSVQASINFGIKSISIKESAMHVSELDRSSFNQYMSFQANLKPYQQFMPRNQGSSTHRDFDDDRSNKGSQQRQIRSLGRDKNKMSSPSLTKQGYTPNNKSFARNEALLIQQQNKMNRSNSIPNQLQNPNKFFSPKSIDPQAQTESNFSFHKNNEQDNIKPKTSTSQFIESQSRQSINSKLGTTQIVLPKQLTSSKSKDLKLNLQKLKTQQQDQKKQQFSFHQSPKQSQQQLAKRLRIYEEAILQKQAVIKGLQLQVDNKRQSLPIDASFTSSMRQNNTKRLSLQLSKSNSQSKRIIGLTQALNQLEGKYTKLTFETQQIRGSWKRQKQELLNTISRHESALNLKDKQIRQKNKLNEILQHNCQQYEKNSNEKLGELIYIKSQLTESQKQCHKVIGEKKEYELKIMNLQTQLKMLHDQSSQSKDQLNKTFADRLTLYQQKVSQAEIKLLGSQRQNKSLSQKINLIQIQQGQLSTKYSSLEQQNKAYLNQIEQAHNQLFSLKEQNESLKKQIQRKENQNREQKQKIWSSKDEQVNYQLKLKNQQIDRIKQESEQRLNRNKQQAKAEIQNVNRIQGEWKMKIQQLQNTIFTLSDQISSYESKISELSQSLSIKQQLLLQVSEKHNNIQSQKKQKQGQHEQLLLSLNSQIQEYQGRIKSLQLQITSLNNALQQKDGQFLKSQQQLQAHRLQLQLTKAQTTIYESKILQQRQYYKKQNDSLRMSCSQHIYQIQIQLQQQYEKYEQLQHIKQMLKQSLDEWQNKCTDDKIASSKAVGRLNDIIKQKQQTMYEMQNIMRTIQKQKLLMQQQMIQQQNQYTDVLNAYQIKQQRLKAFVQNQSNQFIHLYQLVKIQRTQFQSNITIKQQTISQLQTNLQHANTKIQQSNSTIQSLKLSLQTSESSLIQVSSQSQQKITHLKNQHNQQTDEYQQRIRQLQNIINQKDNELLDKEMMISDNQREKQNFSIQIDNKITKINEYMNKQKQLLSQIQIYEYEKNGLVVQNEGLRVNIQQGINKYVQLQNIMIECEQRLGNRVNELQVQVIQLKNKIVGLQQQLIVSDQNKKKIQQSNRIHIQQILNEQKSKIEQMRQLQRVSRQQICLKLLRLQQQNMKLNETILQKTLLIQNIMNQKSIIQQALKQLKLQRDTISILNYKQQIQKYKLQIKLLTQQNIFNKNQLKQIPSLQRTIKIKTIQLNSLKYKSTNNYNSHSIDPDEVSHVQQIIRLKNEQIQILKQQNNKMKDLQLQLYQLQSLNQQLYQSIQQYQQEKFHLNSGLNQKQIQISQLSSQVNSLSLFKTQLKQKNHELSQKMKYYENLILDYKGHEMSSTKSQSQKMNNSRGSSSNKLIQGSNKLIDGVQIQTNYKIQLQTFVKKIKLLQTDLSKYKSINQQNIHKQQSYITQIKSNQQKINLLQDKITQIQKDIQFNKKISNNNKSSTQSNKPIIQYKNPQQVAQTFKQIQTLLKKRNQFHNLQSTLIKLHSSNQQQTNKNKQFDKQVKDKLQMTTGQVNVLSKQFQNLKAKIMKLQGKNYQQKAKIISLLRPCQQSIKQMSRLYDNSDSRQNSVNG